MGIIGFVALSLLALTGRGQAASGAVCGKERDQAGGAIVGAEALLRLPSNQELRSETTDESGQFCFASLEPNKYELQVKAPGFRLERLSVNVESARTAKLELTMSLDRVTEEVTVAEGPGNIASLNVAETRIGAGLLRNLPS